MLSVKSIKDNKGFLEEYFYLSSLEWGDSYKNDNFKSILNKRVSDVLNGINDNIILVLGLFDDDKLMGSLYKLFLPNFVLAIMLNLMSLLILSLNVLCDNSVISRNLALLILTPSSIKTPLVLSK